MSPDLYVPVLAQTNSSDMGDFLSQVSGLLIMTCAAGLIWLGLLAVVIQRASERRRRAAQGLPPLPGFHTIVYRWLVKQLNPQAAPAQPTEAAPAPPPRPVPMPTPDLAALTGDLPAHPAPAALPPQPDLDELFPEPVEAAPAMPGVPAAPEPEPAYAAETPPAAPEPEPLPDFRAVPQAAPPDAVEVLRVWRDLADGRLVVEIGGRRFESLNELRSAELERRFLNVLRELDTLASSAPYPAPAPTPPRPNPLPPAGESPPSMGPGAMLRQMTRVAMGQTPETKTPPVPRSIPDQIEDLLQERLAGLPEFGGREIHVKPSLEGGVRIEVDGTYYDGVGDVADPAVRALLEAIVRDWEAGQ